MKQKRFYNRKRVLLILSFYLMTLMAHSETKIDSARFFFDQAKHSLTKEKQILLSKKALSYSSIKQDTFLIADIYNSLGTAYNEIGIIDKSLFFFIEALNLYKALKNREGTSNILNNLGVIYGERGQYKVALKYFKEALYIKQELIIPAQKSDKTLMYLSGSFNNIGLIHDLMAQYDSALYYFDKSLRIRKVLKENISIADSYSNLGVTYLNMGENLLSEKYLIMSYQIADSIGNIELYANTSYNLSEFYYLSDDIINAKKYVNKCLLIVSIFESKDLLMSVFELKAKISLSMKDYKTAHLYQKRYMALKDSLISIEMESRIAQLQVKYEVQRKEERIDLLEKEKQIEIQRSEFKSILLLILYIFLFTTIVVAFVVHRQKKKLSFSNKELVKRNLEILSIDIKSGNNYTNSENKYASSSLTDDKKQKILSELDNLINNDKIFMETNLNIEFLSNKLSISRTYLSQIVNETFNSNFTVYINKQRINYSMQLLSDPANDKYSVAGIARISGFNSISSFNTLFKLKAGITPSKFRKIASKKTEL